MKRLNLVLLFIAVGPVLFSLSPRVDAADKAYISAAGMPKCMTPGQTATSSVTVVNQGDTTWSSNPAAPVAGCSNADNCPVRLSYHLTGPVNVANGLRTDMPGTVDPQKSQTVSAQIKASDTYGTEVPLPLGKYTLSWQMVREHIGWIEAVTSYTVEVKNSCDQTGSGPSIGLHKGSIGALNGRVAVNTDPHISTIVAPKVSQEQIIAIAGKHFGDSPGSVTMTGFFGHGFVIKKAINLPILQGYWADISVGAGPIPADLVGIDQDVEIQVKSKDGKLSNVKTVRFESLREIKMLPRSAMTPQLTVTESNPERETVTSDPAQPQSLWVVHEAIFDVSENCKGNKISQDSWTAKLQPHQSYHGYLFVHWAGNFPQAPDVKVSNNLLTFPVKWAFEHTDTDYHPRMQIEMWYCYANYLANIYYSTPKGMD